MYPHRVRIWRQMPGSYNSLDVWTPGSDVVVYDGPADAQDMTSRFVRNAQGVPRDGADAVVYLANEELLPSIRPDDLVEIEWEDSTTQAGRVVGVRRLDGKVEVAWR